MLKNYFVVAWRSLIKNRIFSAINIVGLSFGAAVAMLIGLWCVDEITYNKFFPKHDRIVELYHHISFGPDKFTINDVPISIGSTFRDNYPDFESVSMATFQREYVIQHDEDNFSENGQFVDQYFFEIFSVDILRGSKLPVDNSNAVVISETLSSLIFKDDPIGKTIKYNNEDFSIAGVFADFPSNTFLADVKLLFPISYKFKNGKKENDWEDYAFQCFAVLRDPQKRSELETKLKHVLFDNTSNDGKAMKPEALLLPMDDWHLSADFEDGVATGARKQIVIMFALIGLGIIILACINFINLSTARSETRSKEVGVRKVMGSMRLQLVAQFLSESSIVVLVAYIFGIILAAITLPSINRIAEKHMAIPWTDPKFVVISIAFIALTSLLAGIYPSVYLSAFNPVHVLKGHSRGKQISAFPRKILIVVQFTTSIVLMIGTVVLFQQIQYAKDRPVGFDRDRIIQLNIKTPGLSNADYNAVRNELLATGVVENAALSDFPITGAMAADASLTWEGKDPTSEPLVALNSCSHDFPKTNGFQFIEGRDFSRAFSSDSLAVIVNRAGAALIGDGNVIGKKMRFGYGKEREIVGVIEDQIRWTPFVKQSAHIYYVGYVARGCLTIRLLPGIDVQDALKKIENVIKRFDPGAPFDYAFQDDSYARVFHDENRIVKLAMSSALLAIFISCIGIFGLASFITNQRTKEIGIRKVLGASVANVWRLLSADFLKLVLIAIILAVPLGYYLSDQWLSKYEYRIDIAWPVFVVIALIAIAITLLTVSYQTIKTAIRNPTESLRGE